MAGNTISPNSTALNNALQYIQRIGLFLPNHFVNIHHKFVNAEGEISFPGTVHQHPLSAAKDAIYWAERGHDTYMAMGAYIKTKTKKNKKGTTYLTADRTRKNVAFSRGLHMDIDVKPDKPDKAYTSTEELEQAFNNFLSNTGIPVPTFIVSSGTGGRHIYWPLSEYIDPMKFQFLSEALINATLSQGLKCDSECTVDIARLLRISATWNFKTDPASPVTTVSDLRTDINIEDMRKALAPFMFNYRSKLSLNIKPSNFQPTSKVFDNTFDENDNLTRQWPPTDINQVECPFIKETLNTGGKGNDEPLWHKTIALACHCIDPEQTAHRLSNGHGAYGAEDTTIKLKQAQLDRKNNHNLGPPKCITVKSAGATQCDTCPHLALGTTPLNILKQNIHTPRVKRDIIKLVPNILDHEESQDERTKRMIAERRPGRDVLYLASNNPTNTSTNSALATVTNPNVPQTKIEIELLKGNSKYVEAWNTLAKAAIRGTFWFQRDDFRRMYLCNGEEVNDALIRELRNYVISNTPTAIDPSEANVYAAVFGLGDLFAFDSELEYYKSLTWDGVNRIDLLFIKYHGAKDTPLTRAISRKFMIAKARRAIWPGCRHDWMPILESKQGYEKTEFCRVLARDPDRFTDADLVGASDQKQQEALAGRAVYEMAELSTMKKANDDTMKVFMSRTHDRARAAYGHFLKDQARRCVYIGTINPDKKGYLPGEENRRHDPIKVKRANIELLKEDLDQLHAEAYIAAMNSESSVIPKELWTVAAKEQNKRRDVNPWEDIISPAIYSALDLNKRLTGIKISNHEIKDKLHRGAKLENAIKAVIKESAQRLGIPIAHEDIDYINMISEISHKGRNLWFITSDSILSTVLHLDPKSRAAWAGRNVAVIMGRLGWNRPEIPLRINGTLQRGYTYELKARGINPGEWDKYDPTPNELSDEYDDYDENENPATPPTQSGGEEVIEREDQENQEDINRSEEQEDLENQETLDDDEEQEELDDQVEQENPNNDDEL